MSSAITSRENARGVRTLAFKSDIDSPARTRQWSMQKNQPTPDSTRDTEIERLQRSRVLRRAVDEDQIRAR
jgi:hypothetical protein